jgi:hypothetical protein
MVITMEDLKVLDLYTRQYHYLQMAAGKQWMEDVPQRMEKRNIPPLTLWLDGFRPGDKQSEMHKQQKQNQSKLEQKKQKQQSQTKQEQKVQEQAEQPKQQKQQQARQPQPKNESKQSQVEQNPLQTEPIASELVIVTDIPDSQELPNTPVSVDSQEIVEVAEVAEQQMQQRRRPQRRRPQRKRPQQAPQES